MYPTFIEPNPPKLLNVTEYEISRSKQGVKIWTDRTDTFKKLPTFLDGQYLFRTPTKGNKNKVWSIQVNRPSTVYVVTKGEKSESVGKRAVNGNGNSRKEDPANTANKGQQNGEDGKNNGGKHPGKDNDSASSSKKKDEAANGWYEQESSVVTSTDVSLAKILGKNFEGKGINRITLQPIKSDEDWKIIFMIGNIFHV